MAKRIDLSGHRFGRLTVLHVFGRDKHKRLLWACRCDCGAVAVISSNNLRTGNSKSCGCLSSGRRPRICLTGQRFGRLSVLGPLPIKERGKIGKWECQCDCGSKVAISSITLRRSKTKSCGCYRREFKRIEAGKIGDARWARTIKEIFEACVSCGSVEDLHAHHIYPATILSLRVDPSNGVALCRDCHVEFHRRYGKGGHGPEHLVAFMEGGRDLEYLLSLIVGWRDKGGIADLKKAIHYIQFLIESEESRMCSTPSGTTDSGTGD